jgi:hypothetical protein
LAGSACLWRSPVSLVVAAIVKTISHTSTHRRPRLRPSMNRSSRSWCSSRGAGPDRRRCQPHQIFKTLLFPATSVPVPQPAVG